MDESFTGGGFTATQGGSGGGAAPEQKEGVAPLVIKQILSLGDDGIKMFGFSYGVISLVAIVKNVETTSTKITYKLEDHTGTIDAHLWNEEGKADNNEPITMNSYVRVYGVPRNQQGSKLIMVFKIMPVKSVNDVTTHLLEMMHARFQAEKYLQMMEGGGEETVSTRDFMDMDTSGSAGLSNGLKGKHLLIYQAIKGHGTEEGISLQQIHQKFKHIPLAEIRQIADSMSLEGHIYSSIDTEHFLPTE